MSVGVGGGVCHGGLAAAALAHQRAYLRIIWVIGVRVIRVIRVT